MNGDAETYLRSGLDKYATSTQGIVIDGLTPRAELTLLIEKLRAVY